MPHRRPEPTPRTSTSTSPAPETPPDEGHPRPLRTTQGAFTRRTPRYPDRRIARSGDVSAGLRTCLGLRSVRRYRRHVLLTATRRRRGELQGGTPGTHVTARRAA